jgi:hypothetical protein
MPSSPRPVEVKRVLKPQARIDLVLAVDDLTGRYDIRQSMILDFKRDQVIVAQTDPPLLRSKLGQSLEASIVHRNIVTAEITRWGWTATVLSLENKYILNPDEPAAEAVPVIGLSPPDRPVLDRSTIRQAYRLDTTRRSDIHVAIRPMPSPVRLVNFSADGLMLATSAPSPYTIGQELYFKLTFPDESDLPVYLIEGQAEIVRLELNQDERTVNLGLRFKSLRSEAKWALPKILNYYMLEEQRNRRWGELVDL